MTTTKPRGTQDILPGETEKWHYLENSIGEICRQYGFRELRTPVFEHTELFSRTSGESSDIVRKEMYTFEDRGGRSLTLRPEGTASLARAYVENGMHVWPSPVKLYYLAPMFRYEKPQAGRLRQHTQIGIETFGSQEPVTDAEVIIFALDLFDRLGISGLIANLNSIGCADCRPKHRKELVSFLEGLHGELCPDCQGRLDRNPLRVLDCKEESCQRLVADAPVMLDYLCGQCRDHFADLQQYLADSHIEYTVNPHIVRGLDYYTKTVFEIVHPGLGAHNVVCAGGRYDGLIEEVGGPSTPGVGFGMGLERLLMILDEEGIELPIDEGMDVFIATIGTKAARKAFSLVQELRRAGLSSDIDHLGRGLSGQMKQANRSNARWTGILGDDELDGGVITLRNMETGDQSEVPLDALTRIVSGKLEDQDNEAYEEGLREEPV